MPKYSPYAYAKLSMYGQCAHKFKLKYIEKIKTTYDPAYLLKGKYIHERLEKFDTPNALISIASEMPPELIEECEAILCSFLETKTATELLNGSVIGKELQIAINMKLELCEYWGDDCLYRGYVDRINQDTEDSLTLIDWKSGKVRDQGAQLKYYALWAFIKYPHINTVTAKYVFVEHDIVHKMTYQRSELNDITLGLLRRIERVEKERFFMKHRSALCGYCDYYKEGKCTG